MLLATDGGRTTVQWMGNDVKVQRRTTAENVRHNITIYVTGRDILSSLRTSVSRYDGAKKGGTRPPKERKERIEVEQRHW